MTKKTLVSVVVPVYNESEGIEWFHDKLNSYLTTFAAYEFEIIYINDGSVDDSLNTLKSLKTYERLEIKIIDFSRNFGKEAALSAGIKIAKGDAVLMIDADGQHPIDKIGSFIDGWIEGSDVVVGVRLSNTSEGFVKKYGSKIFYLAFNKLAGVELIAGSTDFRLISRRVASEFNKLTERDRISRGLIDWLGYKRSYVSFDADERKFGSAGYTLKKLVKLAVNTFVSLSMLPLFLSGYLGLFFMLLGLIVGVFVIIEQVLLGDPMNLAITGTAMLGILIVFLVGVILSTQGLLALYVARVLGEAQGRPLYVVRETIDIK